ncbi:MAG: UDP-N-acetylmuramate--L-alanine ligase, partial [Actinomycetota bacterium]
NARSGSAELSVAESDESDGSFLLLNPSVAIVTNVEADHLDHWGSLEAIRDGFGRFFERVEPSGAIVVPTGDEGMARRAADTRRTVITWGAGGDVEAQEVSLEPSASSFELSWRSERHRVRLNVPGALNIWNALAAAGGCLAAGIAPAEVARGLGAYRGVQRRYEVRGYAGGVTVIDDYAHHPSEVSAILETAAAGGWERVVAVFQPHRYSRTALQHGEFGDCFRGAHRVVVTDVYGAGEEPVPGVTGKLVADSVCEGLPGRSVAYIPHREELLDYLAATARPGDALLTLGAGDITSVGEEMLARLGEER